MKLQEVYMNNSYQKVGEKHYIVIDEVPYGINTSDLKNKVAKG